MKILHIIDSGGLYGAESILLTLMEEQRNTGLKPVLGSIGVNNIFEKPLETEATKRGLTVKKFRMRNGPNFLGALKIFKFAQSEGFDLMHSHGYKGNILLGFIPKKVRKIPLVSTLHGWTSADSFTKIKLYEWLDAKSLRYMDAVIVVSKSMLSNPKIRNSKGIKLSVIHNGIPLLNFDISTKLHNSFASSYSQCPRYSTSNQSKSIDKTLNNEIIDFCLQGYTVGSIGRLSTEKGFKYLIEAIHILKIMDLDIKLIIIGEGHKRSELKKMIDALCLSSNVLIPGYKDNAWKYLPLFNVFVLPSLTEGFPITLLEAMQAKVPIIATKIESIPEILQNGHGGILVEPCNPEKLAEALLTVYRNPKRAEQLASFSYNEAIINYTSSKMALQYTDIYQKLINHNQPTNSVTQ